MYLSDLKTTLGDRRLDVVQVDGIGHAFDFAWNTPEPVNLYPHLPSDQLLNFHASIKELVA
jgi:hypothetical protein